VPTFPDLGSEFAGYRLERLIARGGMGIVFEATHLRLSRRVALKLLAPELAEDQDFRERFLKEALMAAELEHPHVVPVYDAGEEDGVLFLSMRYLAGGDLRQLLQREGRILLERTLRIVDQVAGALDAAHERGLVHRDVKPANILFSERRELAYLSDFGVAKRQSSKGLTHTGSFLGSVDYCAPEQIESALIDGRADVYALGGVFYHCLTGQPPYVRETEIAVLTAHLRDPPPALSRSRPDLPPALDGVLVTAMAKYPQVRHETAGGFAQALHDALAEPRADQTLVEPPPPPPAPLSSPGPTGELETAAHPQSPPTRVSPGGGGRRRLVLAAVGAVLLLAAAVLAGALLAQGDDPTAAPPPSTDVVTEPSSEITTTTTTAPVDPPVVSNVSLTEHMIPPGPPHRCVSPFHRDHDARMGLRLRFADGTTNSFVSSGPGDTSESFLFCGGTRTHAIPGFASAPVRFTRLTDSGEIRSLSGVVGADFESGGGHRVGLVTEVSGEAVCSTTTDGAGHARRVSCRLPRGTRLQDVVLRLSVEGDSRYGVFAGIGDLRGRVVS
jgi:serine/threonine protein kinase